MNPTDIIRDYFRRMGNSTPAQAARATGISGDKTRSIVGDLVEKGWLVKISPAIYEYREVSASDLGRAGALRTKLWRAIKMSRTAFTVWDMAQLSGATLDYAKKYVASLLHQSLAEKFGMRGPRAIYRLVPGAENRPAPLLIRKSASRETEIQQIIDTGWEMMRALRDGDMKRAAEIHGRIGALLEVKP